MKVKINIVLHGTWKCKKVIISLICLSRPFRKNGVVFACRSFLMIIFRSSTELCVPRSTNTFLQSSDPTFLTLTFVLTSIIMPFINFKLRLFFAQLNVPLFNFRINLEVIWGRTGKWKLKKTLQKGTPNAISYFKFKLIFYYKNNNN